MSSGGGGGGEVGMATNIAGSEMERWAAILTADAMNKQFSSQMREQNQFRQQGMGMFGQYAPTLSAESANKEMATGAANREQNYSDVQNRSLGVGDKSDATTNAALALQGQQRARVGGYGDWQTQQSNQASDFQTGQNRIASRAGGAAQVFPYQMSRAQHSMDWLNMLGEMVKGAGGGAANFGMLSQQPSQAPTAQQYGAMQAGYGPVNQQFAQGLYQQQYGPQPGLQQQMNQGIPQSVLSFYGY